MKKKRIILLIITFLLLAIIFTVLVINYNNKKNNKIEKSAFVMDTLFTQTAYGTQNEDGLEQVKEQLEILDKTLSRHNSDSEISLINQNSGNWVNVSKGTFDILQESVKLCQKSNGSFDITLGSLIDLWDINGEPRVPTQQEISASLETVGYENIEFDEQNYSVRIKEGASIDLGGLVKGYATDLAAETYAQNGITSAIISANSSIYSCGLKPDGEQFVLGIRDPRGTANDFIGTLKVQDTFIGSSGDYERYFEQDGKRYHHIMDPETGYPADKGIMGITVCAESGIEADYLSTYLFVMGIDYTVQHLDEYNIIVVDTDKNVYVSEKLEDSFEFDQQSGYTLK